MGRTPQPLSQFVLKVHSRCDLACDHCYVYEKADKSWRGRPAVISEEVLEVTARRIAEHASTHSLDTVSVVLHGGEPLLAGRARLRRTAEALRTALDGVCELDLRVHTNGVTLDQRFCDLFAELDIKVGISLDGDKAANDLHRVYRNGRSSHDKVLRAVSLLSRPRYQHLFAGILCTIDLRNDPVAVYDALAALEPPRIDFLLPHSTWEDPPLRLPGDTSPTPYADWLLTVHDRWSADGRPMDVRIFDSVVRTLRGESSLTESLGLAPADLAVIETDGTFEQADSLKTSYDGAPATGMDVFHNTLDDVAAHPGVVARQQGLDGLCATCRTCPVVQSCGGGLYAHRYRVDNEFDNPSVYCGDLEGLIVGIRDRDRADQATSVSTRAADPAPVLAASHLDELAAGAGGGAVADLLVRHQLGLHRELLALVWQQAHPDAAGARAWETLAVLDGTAPHVVDSVLAHPYVRPWGLYCLDGDATQARAQAAMRGVAEIAAVAALLAGQPGTVAVPVVHGVLRLPTLGTLAVGDATEAHVSGDADGFTVEAGGTAYRMEWKGVDDPAWSTRRRFELDGWAVALEDTDPWRNCHDHPMHPRLTEPEAEEWHTCLKAAWEWIRRELPAYAPAITAELGVVTPLSAPPHTDSIGSVGRGVFGAVGIARPATPESLALLLVRGFQYGRMNVLLDLMDLQDPSCEALLTSPGGSGPRPARDVLLESYEHIAVIDFWHARRRGTTGEVARTADASLRRHLDHATGAIACLMASGTLTPVGSRFVAGLREAVRTRGGAVRTAG
ncbi:FxsB family cyclophane-forming radical SAM/SPASM peptide maturase [Streptomyces sp. SID12488]|uniref:FxsB family cyclophane-forming radical SAM/SPASM peptide maturase n=1 Tax=Streptomyces sp. SID12488 TaxID=2706040 RepID=UPI0013DA0C36|nr:FxsB family cyclophane-forming radical SAM/SPASM peptide maturase [Streptomyces sp. SID12488]NEA62605.1 FxsB family radical SAM/SPASM domain protein [Streptomyces sp. SID12488]